MKNIFILITAILWILTALPVLAASPIIEKGRDISSLLRNDSISRSEADQKNKTDKEHGQALIEAMYVNEVGSECIAYEPTSESCLLSVDEYNRSLASQNFSLQNVGPNFPNLCDIEKEQTALLKILLDEKFLSNYPLQPDAKDSLNKVFQVAKEERLKSFRKHQGDSALHILYRKYYASLFQSKEEKQYQVISSSDSILVDSLYKFTTAKWDLLPQESLPSQLATASAKMSLGESKGPIHLPFGFAYLHFAQKKSTPNISFEAAVPMLISMQNVPKELEILREKVISDYYLAHRQEFLSPDTVQYRMWLLPNSHDKKHFASPKNIQKDTTQIHSLVVQQFQLPEEIQEKLNLYRVHVGHLLGPMRTFLGTWYFLPLNIRNGGMPIALLECRTQIARFLFGTPKWNSETIAKSESQTKENDLWKSIVSAYLSSQVSNPNSQLEEQKREWYKNQLVFHFINPSVSEISKSNSD